MMKKVLAQLLVFVVYISISFANQVVPLEIDKANINNVAEIELYQNADIEPFITLDATLPKPWIIPADLTSINGVVNVYAIPVDADGMKGSMSPIWEDILLDGSDITIKRVIE